ncbi:hypothetical protein F4861DRAFT_485660 [Xylaria intraflava]|nr:hypothetical protein F4861DRAFT_485660 [Xylaria intraflava]
MRQPRSQRIIDSSRETGMILCGLNADAGLSPEKVRQVLATKWDIATAWGGMKTEAVVELDQCMAATWGIGRAD